MPHAETPPDRDPDPGIDPRVSFANERTFLAWIRTALGLMAAGVLIAQVFPQREAASTPRFVGLGLIVLGAVLGLVSYRRWRENEERISRQEPLKPTRLPALTTALITVAAGLALVLALWAGR